MPKFNYTIVPLHQVCETQKNLVNDIYDMWKGTFGKVLDDAGTELDVADFFRCHSAGVLLYHNEVVGFNLFTNFDFQLRAHRDHPYFQELDPQVVEAVSQSSRKIMTMEYFTVSPLWRRQSMEVPWGEILAGLGLNYMDHSPACVGLGTPRTDIKVDQMCERLGASIRGHVEKMNYRCAIVVFDKKEKEQRSFENPLTSHWVKRLWRKYLHPKDYTKDNAKDQPHNSELQWAPAQASPLPEESLAPILLLPTSALSQNFILDVQEIEIANKPYMKDPQI